jgi:oxygen-independent coproporphyrinogen-3 oxidase
MAGIYIHIPFCKQACLYCNFHFSTTKKLMPDILRAINREAIMQKDYLTERVTTVYFGGGTPSIIATNEIHHLLIHLKQHFDIAENAEITLEANPDDINEEKLLEWKSIGINRLSIGIQSFHDTDLLWMNRAHQASHAFDCLHLATQHFDNITIDLIYGSPTLTDEQWKYNIDTALSFNIPHLSCYALTVEEKTALAAMIASEKKENTNADKQAVHFDILVQSMKDAGYEHYEISNFAKPGYRSKHNSSYWKGLPYLGLGPSAHSFNGSSRQWNIANNALYIQSIEQGNLNYEKEALTATQQLNEWIMTGLRTIEGIDLKEKKWQLADDRIKTKILATAEKWQNSKHIIIDQDCIRLTDQGKFLADGIAADLFQI